MQKKRSKAFKTDAKSEQTNHLEGMFELDFHSKDCSPPFTFTGMKIHCKEFLNEMFNTFYTFDRSIISIRDLF